MTNRAKWLRLNSSDSGRVLNLAKGKDGWGMFEALAKIVGSVVIGIFVLFLAICISFYYAWIATILWSWFLVPFHFPQITILHMWGLILIIRLIFTIHDGEKLDYKSEKYWRKVSSVILNPLFILLSGYIIHSYM